MPCRYARLPGTGGILACTLLCVIDGQRPRNDVGRGNRVLELLVRQMFMFFCTTVNVVVEISRVLPVPMMGLFAITTLVTAPPTRRVRAMRHFFLGWVDVVVRMTPNADAFQVVAARSRAKRPTGAGTRPSVAVLPMSLLRPRPPLRRWESDAVPRRDSLVSSLATEHRDTHWQQIGAYKNQACALRITM